MLSALQIAKQSKGEKMIDEIRGVIQEKGIRKLVWDFLVDYHITERIVVVILGAVLVIVAVPIVWFFANVVLRSEIEFLQILEVVGVSVAMFIMFGVELIAGIVKKVTASRWAKRYAVDSKLIDKAAELGWINQRGWYKWDDYKLRSWVQTKQTQPR